MDLCAHRGCAGQFPENTRRAVRECAAHVDRIELDVRRCGSGELVVHHADDLSAKTDATGHVHATHVDDLGSVDVLGSGCPIPRFEALLDDVPAAVDLQVDLKHAGMVGDLLDAVDGREHDVYACSTRLGVLRRVAETPLPLGYVSFPYFEDRPVSDEELERVDYGGVLADAAALDCAFVEAPTKLCVGTDFVADAHDAGLDVVAWPVDAPEDADRLREAGVDGLMANRYDVV